MSVHRGSRHACRAPAQPVQMLKAHHKSALHMLGNADAFASRARCHAGGAATLT